MIKVFISQPMADKTKDEILEERKQAEDRIKQFLMTSNIEIIDSYFDEDVPNDTKTNGAYYLGKSIELLSKADYVYFCKGWENARGCILELDVCITYSIPYKIEKLGDIYNDQN